MRHARCLRLGLTLLLAALLALPSLGAAPQSPSWTQFSTLDGLPSDTVWAIAAGPGRGDVWVATSHGAGLYRDGRWYAYTQAHGLGADWVAALTTDARGRVWFGTFGGGLTILDGSDWRTYTAANSGLASDWVSALATDPQGRIWCGTWGRGVSVFDNGRWHTYDSGNSPLPADYVTALAAAPDGSVYIALHGQGTARLANGVWTLYDTGRGLPDDFVNALAAGPEGDLWVGTAKGLCHLDREGRVVATYTAANGLPSDLVLSLVLDTGGRLWVGTSRGAALLADGRWTAYHATDGLAHDYVSAIAVAEDGVWFGSLSAGVARFGTGAVAAARRLPVILVHGWHGPESDRLEDSEFRFLAAWLREDGFPVYYAEGISPKNTLHQNAAQLRSVIDRAKAESGAAQVDIIAFSMGGLNARTYVESGLYAGDVDQVFILGTPQAGVRLWYPFLLREVHEWSRDPSAIELTPEYATLFNSLHRNEAAVPYVLIAGNARSKDLPEILRGLPPGDGLISAASALALDGPSVRKILTDDLHAWSDETILLGLPSFLWPRRTYDAYIRNPLRLGPDAALPSVSEPPPTPLPLPDPPLHSPFYSGEVGPGQTVTSTVLVDTAGETRFYLRSQGGPLTFSLVDPQGQRLDGETIEGRGEYLDLGFADAQAYLVPQAQPGEWQVVVGRPLDASGSVRFTGFAALTSPLRLSIGTAPQWGSEGEPAAITATLRSGELAVPRARVEAEIGRPDMQVDRLALFDDGEHGDGESGDGTYGASYRPPALGGYYTLFVTATGSFQGRAFARTAERLFAVSPGTAELSGRYAEAGLDSDHDGRYEGLTLEVGVDAHIGGSYLLAATLADRQGREIARAVAPCTLNPGPQTVALQFLGSAIARSGVDGPYVVSRVVLLDEAGAAVPLQEARSVLTTRSYRCQDFRGP